MLLGGERCLLWDAQLVLCSRMADRRQGERVLQQLVRTVSTMAPERARGGPISAPMDVYSLGALLAYSAGSEQPIGDSALAVTHAIATGNFKPKIPDALPSIYCHMLARMLSPQASDRPSMREVEAFFAAPPGAASLNVASLNVASSNAASLNAASPNAASPFSAPRLQGEKAASAATATAATATAATASAAAATTAAASASSGQPGPSPVASAVSGVDWIHMLETNSAAQKPETEDEPTRSSGASHAV
jgi:serine/threonine protein kinase